MEGSKQNSPKVGRRPEIDRDTILRAALGCLGSQRSVVSLSLREVARAAGIAPNSIYRHFESIEDLAVTLIELAGQSLREIIGAARQQIDGERSVVLTSTEIFFQQLDDERMYLPLLLREGDVGPERVREAVEQQLQFFEQELQHDLVRLSQAHQIPVYEPELAARAITRLVFIMGARALHLPRSVRPELVRQTAVMVRMIVTGTQSMARIGTKS